MKDYKKVLEFNYKGTNYIMYLDDTNRKFFLKKDEKGNLSYVTDEEFADLESKMSYIKQILDKKV